MPRQYLTLKFCSPRRCLTASSLPSANVEVNRVIWKKYVQGLNESIEFLEYGLVVANNLVQQIDEIRETLFVAIVEMDTLHKREMAKYNKEADSMISEYEAEMENPAWWRPVKSWVKAVPDKPARFKKPKPQISHHLRYTQEIYNYVKQRA